MEFSEVIQIRKSTRRFILDKPIPENTLREILNEAARSPSFKNTQPWEVVVAGRSTMEKIASLHEHHSREKTTTQAYPWPDSYPERQKRLTEETMKAREGHRTDPENEFAKHCYNAPTAVYIHIHKQLNEWR